MEKQYGGSSSLCDYILARQLETLKPGQIVDFGAGGGKVGRLAREILGDSVDITAVEGWHEAVQMLSSDAGPYDRISWALIQDWVATDPGCYDLAVFGDVLEHLSPREIRRVIKQCLGKFKELIIVCPLHDISQNEAYGNRLEVHATYVTPGFFDNFNVVEKHIVKGREWTIMNVRITSVCEPKPVRVRLLLSLFHAGMLIFQPIGLGKPFGKMFCRCTARFKWLQGA